MFPRTTISFYRYVQLENIQKLRDELFVKWSAMNCLGRVYLAAEGVNAQMSVPTPIYKLFVQDLYTHECFKDVPIKVAVTEESESFWKLNIKIKQHILADGLAADSYDPSDVGRHFTAKDFNEAMDNGAVVIDMRNNYECEVGHFDGAYCPKGDTFREVLHESVDKLTADNVDKDQQILTYCTGGIRCEKASAWLRKNGYKKVGQLHGGIIDYAHQVKKEGLECKYKGVNFVFDGRMAEAITEDVLGACHHCGKPCNAHVNCHNKACHLLYIQCEKCQKAHGTYCTPDCRKVGKMSTKQQENYRKAAGIEKRAQKASHLNVYNGRRVGSKKLQDAWVGFEG